MNKVLLGILIAAALVRIYHIDFPVAGWHAWRQSDTAGIAWNFVESGFRLLYPQVIWSGSTSGYIEAEFQIYPYIVALLHAAFGMTDLWGRAVSVIFALSTTVVLYSLVRRILDKRVALWSAALYAFLPLNMYYGRAFMPESMMLFCISCGILFFHRWLDSEKWIDFVIAWVALTLAALIKLPALHVGLPLVFLAWQRDKWTFALKLKNWLLAGSVVLPVVLWYLHADALYEDSGLTFGIWNFSERKFGARDLLLTASFYDTVFLRNIGGRHLTYIGFLVFLVGLFVKRKTAPERLFDWWLAGSVIMILVVGKHNLEHDYYQLPFTLAASVFIAKVFSRHLSLKEWRGASSRHRIRMLVLAMCIPAILTLSVHRWLPLMRMESPDAPLLQLARVTRAHTADGDRIVALSTGNPEMLYASKRRGWIVAPDTVHVSLLERLSDEGAVAAVGYSFDFNSSERTSRLQAIASRFPVIAMNENYFIVSLRR